MKTIAGLLSLVALTCAAAPEDDVRESATTVSLAIAAASRDELSSFIRHVDLAAIAAHRDHPRSPDEVVALLRGIGADKSTLRPMYTEDPNLGIVMVYGATNYEIELRRKTQKDESIFRIVAIK